MAKALQRRRGTTAEHANFTGLEGEFTYDTTEKRIVAHDGTTAGGIPMAKKAELDSAKTELQGKIDQVTNSLDPRILDAASQSDILEAVSQATVGNVNAPTLEGLQSQISANTANILPNTTVHIVEAWRATDGNTWYRKWSDGWVEQGGVLIPSSGNDDYIKFTVTLPVAYVDTTYVAMALGTNQTTVAESDVCTSKTSTTVGFQVHCDKAYAYPTFYCCGYSA